MTKCTSNLPTVQMRKNHVENFAIGCNHWDVPLLFFCVTTCQSHSGADVCGIVVPTCTVLYKKHTCTSPPKVVYLVEAADKLVLVIGAHHLVDPSSRKRQSWSSLSHECGFSNHFKSIYVSSLDFGQV